MEHINLDKVQMKYIMHFNKHPEIEDPFYEILTYIDYLDRDTFTELEYSTKTKFKVCNTKEEEINLLKEKGYIIQESKAKKYKVIKHPWC